MVSFPQRTHIIPMVLEVANLNSGCITVSTAQGFGAVLESARALEKLLTQPFSRHHLTHQGKALLKSAFAGILLHQFSK